MRGPAGDLRRDPHVVCRQAEARQGRPGTTRTFCGTSVCQRDRAGVRSVARTIFRSTDLDALLRRFDRLTPDAHARWGTMTVHRMICHVSDSLRVHLGEMPAEFRGGHLANPVARWLLAYVIPFPKAKAQTAPEMLQSQPSDWHADLTAAREQLRAAAARGPDGPWARHPAFGDVSGKMYGVFVHKHVDHHLRQFGV